MNAIRLHSPAFTDSKVLLFILLVLALLLRLYDVTQPFNSAFAWRQCSTAMMAENYYKGNWNIFYPEVSWVGPGPGYQGREFQLVTYITALLFNVFGLHEWVGRLVVIFFGVWGVFALYQLVQRIWGDKHALAAAFVMTVLPGSIYVDRSFLPDPAMVSLITTSLWQWVAYLQTDKKKHLCLAGLFGCLGFLTKITGMVVGLPMLYAVYIVFESTGWPRKKIRMLVLTAASVLLPVISYYVWARYLSLTYPPYHFAGQDNWIWNDGILNWLKEKYFFERNYFHLETRLWGTPFIILSLMGLIVSLMRKRLRSYTDHIYPTGSSFPYLFHVWLLGCLLFYLIGARELSYNPWNFHVFSPVIAIFSGRAIVFILSSGRNRMIGFLQFAFVFVVIAITNFHLLKNLFRYPYIVADYQMGKALQTAIKPGDLVVTFAADPGDPTSIFYSGARGWVFPPYGSELGAQLSTDDRKNIASIEDLRRKGAGWFGIVNEHYTDIKANHPEFACFLQSNYTVEKETEKFVIFRMKR
jgi:4-amino-4-deoxy-L-arabinose transferase-like glycosyltransferase